jgi:hypothetical protein
LAVYALIVSLAGSWRGGLRHRCYGKNVNQIWVLLIGIGATVVSLRNIIAVFPIIFIRYVNRGVSRAAEPPPPPLIRSKKNPAAAADD